MNRNFPGIGFCLYLLTLVFLSSTVSSAPRIIFGSSAHSSAPQIDSNDVAQPIHLVRPIYPLDAAMNHYEATVILKLRIGKDSTVKQSTVEYCSNRDKGFEDAASNAAKGSRFAPPGVDRKGHERWLYHTVTFKAYDVNLGDSLPSPDDQVAIDSPSVELTKIMVAPVLSDSAIRFEVPLRLLVDTIGLVRNVLFAGTSGDPKVDTQIYKTAFWTTFTPARKDEKPVACWRDWIFRFDVPSHFIDPTDSTDLTYWAEPRSSIIRINVKSASKFVGYVPSPGFVGLNVEGVTGVRLTSDPIPFVFDVSFKVRADSAGPIDSVVLFQPDSVAPWLREFCPMFLRKMHPSTSAAFNSTPDMFEDNWVLHGLTFDFVLGEPSFQPKDIPDIDEYLPFDVAPEPMEPLTLRYPQIARMGKFESTLWVTSLVDSQGWVRFAYVKKATGFPAFDEAALTAVTKRRFKPAMLAGEPVQAWVTDKIEFRLEG